MAPMVDGAVKSENGVQVIAVGIKDGYYSPNTFAAKSGGPIKVVFTGKATDCLANPTFKSLNKTVNIEKTGTGTIDLGTLKVGTYEFGCSMGMTGGKIVVQ
jgi:plastocyanin domain-containing protein